MSVASKKKRALLRESVRRNSPHAYRVFCDFVEEHAGSFSRHNLHLRRPCYIARCFREMTVTGRFPSHQPRPMTGLAAVDPAVRLILERYQLVPKKD